MQDMNPELVTQPRLSGTLSYFDGTRRKVLWNDGEEPFPDGRLIVSRTDPRGIITHVNRSFVEMSGYAEEELIGAPHCILRHPDMPASVFRVMWETLSAGIKWQGYIKNLRKDGRCYWVHATVVPNLRDGVVLGYTSVRSKPAAAKVRECAVLYRSLA